MKSPFKYQRGSALMLAMLTLMVGLGMVTIMMTYSNRLSSSAGEAKRQERLKYAAKSGIEMAKADLEERAEEGDFHSVSLASPLGSSDHENVGLVRTTGGWSDRTAKARLTINASDGTKVEVYYLPTAETAAASASAFSGTWPKFYQIVSKASNTKTGKIYTEEAMIYLYRTGGADAAFAIIDPTTKAGIPLYVVDTSVSSFSISPGIFRGHAHFGFDSSLLTFQHNDKCDGWSPGGCGISSNYYSDPFEFWGTVSFKGASNQACSDSTTSYNCPFRHSSKVSMYFDKGYKADDTSFTTAYDFPDIYADALASAPAGVTKVDVCTSKTPSPVDGRKRACILFSDVDAGGRALEYTCHDNPYQWNPALRYVNGPSNDGSGGVNLGTPIQTYAGAHMFTCDGGDIEIKGIYKTTYSVVAENIIIGGDVVNADQSVTSPYKMGLIAQKDIIIPTDVPAPTPVQWWDSNVNGVPAFWSPGSPPALDCTLRPDDMRCACTSVPTGFTCDTVALHGLKRTKDPITSYWTGVTNFLAPTTDRDIATSQTTHPATGSTLYWIGGTDYFDADPGNSLAFFGFASIYPYKRGQYNNQFVLDTDFAAIAGGAVKMDGFWNRDQFADQPNSSVMITDSSSNVWEGLTLPGSPVGSTGHANAYLKRYGWFNGPTGERAEPAYCCRTAGCGGVDTSRARAFSTATGGVLSSCIQDGSWWGDYQNPRLSMTRPRMHSWRHFGSLIVKDYSYMKFNINYMDNQGFGKTYFTYDTRLSSGAPPGFPTGAAAAQVDILWSKGSEGKSSTLTTNGIP